MNKRVAITGMGIACPLGRELGEVQKALVEGKSGIGEVSRFDASRLVTRIAAETELPSDYLSSRGDFKVRLMHWAAQKAMAHCGELAYKADEGVVSLGVGLGFLSLPRLVQYFGHQEPPEPSRGDSFLQYPSERVAVELARKHGLSRPPHILVSACAASADALGVAFDEIRRGRLQWVLAGGTDSMINPMGFSAFCLLGAMSRKNDLLGRASRPFDRNRDGFVMGEGAGAVILEEWESARKRGAHILGEFLGWGNSFDAYGISEPHPEGQGAVLAMKRALKMADLSPSQIDYINAHGTSTPKNDIVETRAIVEVFGEEAPPVSSTKSQLGHCISAAGVVEFISVFLAAEKGYLPATINLENPDEGCHLDYIPQRPRKAICRYFMSNSFAFGGQNTSLVAQVGGEDFG